MNTGNKTETVRYTTGNKTESYRDNRDKKIETERYFTGNRQIHTRIIQVTKQRQTGSQKYLERVIRG